METGSFDMVLAIDISSTMLVQDVEPTRIDAVKDASRNIISDIEGNSRVGILSFGSTSRIIQPLTSKKLDLKHAIDKMSIRKHSSTDLAQAITTSTNMLIGSNNSRMILLFTDGQHNIGTSVDEALSFAIDEGIIIHPVVVGTNKGGQVQGINISFTPEFENIRSLADKTEGGFSWLNNTMDSIDFNVPDSKKRLVKVPLSDNLLYAVLVILFLEFVLVKTIFKITP
ncbi:MAG: vWA domain-containing protein [Candidatus Woesearchaeota archaeon]